MLFPAQFRSCISVLLASLILGLVLCARAGAEFESGALTGVVKIEVALDSFSFGPELAEDLFEQTSLTPYQRELLRRLQNGASGSAFCVYPGLLVTNAHLVLAGARYSALDIPEAQWETLEAVTLASTQPRISVTRPGQRRFSLPTQVLALDIKKDLALLHFHDEQGAVTPLELAEPGSLEAGIPVVAVGYSAHGLKVTRGEVLSLIRGREVVEPALVSKASGRDELPLIVGAADGKIARFQHSAPTEEGISGGPIINQEGKVVGVAYALLRSPQRAGLPSQKLPLAISCEILRDFLEGQVLSLPARTPGGVKFDPAVIPQTDSGPPAVTSRSAWLGSTQELEEVRRSIRYGNAGSVIPVLTARLRRNRYDYEARALLSAAHHEEALYAGESKAHALAAFYQSMWLSYFAPEMPFARDARAYVRNQDAQRRAAKFVSTPGTRALFYSLALQAKFDGALRSGNIVEQSAILHREMRELLEACEKEQERAAKSDIVAQAALISAMVSMEEAAGLWSGTRAEQSRKEIRARRELLRKALGRAQALAASLDKSPGAYALVGLIYARLSRLENEAENRANARKAYEIAATLDPNSATIKEALREL